MTDESPPPPDSLEPPAPEPPVQPPPERFPFWGYTDLLMFVGFGVVSMIAGMLAVKAVLVIFHVKLHNELLAAMPGEFLGYLCLFGLVALMFRVQYGRPFWPSMGWTPLHTSGGGIVAFGVLLAFAVAFAGKVLQTPDIPTPMTKLLSDRTSVVLAAVFGITLAPLCEELIFRGFLQPLFIRSLGALPGVVLAGLLFGLLHLSQYGNSWRHGLLITMAGSAFGWMRYRTGSTKASTLMHAAYNATLFVGILSQWRSLPHSS